MVGIFLKHSQFNITKPLQKRIFRPPMIANPHQLRKYRQQLKDKPIAGVVSDFLLLIAQWAARKGYF